MLLLLCATQRSVICIESWCDPCVFMLRALTTRLQVLLTVDIISSCHLVRMKRIPYSFITRPLRNSRYPFRSRASLTFCFFLLFFTWLADLEGNISVGKVCTLSYGFVIYQTCATFVNLFFFIFTCRLISQCVCLLASGVLRHGA